MKMSKARLIYSAKDQLEYWITGYVCGSCLSIKKDEVKILQIA